MSIAVWVWMTVVAIVVTKGFDAWTTLRAVGRSGEGETNAFAQRWMRRFGVRSVAAVVFAVATVVAVTTGVVVVASEEWSLQLGYVVVGGFVAFVQGAVAHTNATGRWNFVTRRVLAFHRWLAQRAASR